MNDHEEIEEADCCAACAEALELATIGGDLARFARLDARTQRELYREVRRLARGYRREGYGPDDVAARVIRHISRNERFQSIVLTLLIAALAATVRFWVLKFWERWFPDEAPTA